MDNVEKTKTFFREHVEWVKRIKDIRQQKLSTATAEALQAKLHGAVLDIGSGYYCDYPPDSIDRLFCLDISFSALKRERKNEKIVYISGDARALEFKDDTFDTVLMLQVIHHLAGNDIASTYGNVTSVLKECHRVLKRSGRIFIVDAFCPEGWQAAEKLFFGLGSPILKLFGRPMVYFFSLPSLLNLLSQAGFDVFEHRRLDTGESISSIGIRFKYTPLSHILIEGAKGDPS